MSGRETPLAVAEIMPEQLRVFQTDLEQRAFSRRLKMRDARFVEMSAIVELMAELRIFFPTLLADPTVSRRVGMHRAKRVEIAIRLLRRGDARNPLVEFLLERGIGFHAQHIRGALDRLIGIGIVERELRRRLDLKIFL